jgi:Tol biopolymer transport system component
MKKLVIMISVLAVLALSFVHAAQQSGYDLFQKALAKERAEGNLEEAISLYQKVIEVAKEKSLAADAQLHIGICYEKLGRTEAIKAYEQVLKNFPSQSKQVSAARERLAALQAKESHELSTKLLDGPLAAMSQSLSPDGTKLTVTPLDKKGFNIGVYDLSSKQLHYVTRFGWGEKQAYFASWSPNGDEIVFGQSSFDPEGSAEIAISTIDGKARILYRVESMKEGHPVPYCWLSDRSAIVASLLNPDNTGTLGLISLSGGSFKALHSLKGAVQKFERIADASPDGRYIVFQERDPQGKHDLYTIGTDGTSLEVLSDHPADDTSPRWSPDGKYIVFLSQRGQRMWALWGIAVKDGKPAGEPFLIKRGIVPMLNWTQRGLAYHESLLLRDIYTATIDPETLKITGKPSQLSYTPTGDNVCPSWSPDGKQLAFGVRGEGRKIVIVTIEGGEIKEFPNPDKRQQIGVLHDLRWLRDGSGLSLSGLDRDGKLTLFQLDLKTGEWKGWPIPATKWTRTEWSSDGQSFLYARHGFFQDEPGIIERNPETGSERYVYKPEGELGSIFRQLKFSRDFTKLAFTEDNARIKLIDMKTGKHRDLTSEHHGHLALSPDGEHIISTGIPNELGHNTAVFIISSTDGSIKKLDLGFPKNTTFADLDWSPDGRQIAFVVGSQKFEIHLMKNVIPKEQIKK